MGDPLGGHLVAGHVDGVGTVLRRRREQGDALELDDRGPAGGGAHAGAQGLDRHRRRQPHRQHDRGRTRSRSTLIPHTLAVTNLGAKPAGALVNLEADLIAKHIDRLMAPLPRRGPGAGTTPRREISVEMLRRYGFVR